MTTSPFGTPSAFGGTSTLDRDDAAPRQGAGGKPSGDAPRSSRSPLVLVLAGVGAVAVLGLGGWFLFGPSDDVEPTVPQARGTAVATPSVEPTPEAEPVSEFDVLAGRNPFAAQIVEGGAGVAATAPVTTTTGAGTSVADGGTTGGTGATSGPGGLSITIPGEAGPAGKNGSDGKNGADGRAGAAGADGLTPLFITIQVVDVDESTNTADLLVRTADGETGITDLEMGSALSEDTDSILNRVVYTLVGTDSSTPPDGQFDFITISVDGVDYTTQVGETFLGFVYE